MTIPVLTIDSYPGKTVASVIGNTTAASNVPDQYGPGTLLENVIEKLATKAAEAKADAVFGFTFSTSVDAGGYYYVIASGTLVKFASDEAVPF